MIFWEKSGRVFFLTIKIADNINMIAEVFHVFY